MCAHSIGLRERAVSFVEEGGTRCEAARIFKVGERTIRRWLSLKERTGKLERLPQAGKPTPKVSEAEFRAYVDAHPDLTLAEYGKHFGLVVYGVWYNMRKYGYLSKKNTSLPGARRKKAKRVSGRDKRYSA